MGKAVAPTNAQIRAGAARGNARQQRSYAKKLAYRSVDNVIVLSMYSGATISVPNKDIKELRDATQNDLRELRLTPGGGMIWSKSLDLHISVPGILRHILGLDWFERAGRARTEAKKAAVQRNGMKGGRPKRKAISA